MAYKKPQPQPKAQQSFEKEKTETSNDTGGAGIRETSSWINMKGKAIYVNIAEADLVVKDGRVSFITSVTNLRRLVDGEIGGVKLGQFEE